jgi:hypothetical protein
MHAEFISVVVSALGEPFVESHCSGAEGICGLVRRESRAA